MKKILTFVIVFWPLLSGCSRGGDPPAAAQADARTVPCCKVTLQKVPISIEATGTVQPDLDGGARILTPLAGVVSRIFVRIGDPVRTGDALAAVRSSEMSDAYSGYLTAEAQRTQAERQYTLNKELLAIGAVTRNDYLASESAYEAAKAAAEGLKRKLDMYGVGTAEGFRDQLVLRAPIDGRVADITAHIGDRFDTSTPLLDVVNPERIVVVVNLYDTDIARIRKGQAVTFATDVFPDLEFHGLVTYLSDAEDPDSKTVKTYIRVEGSRGLFKQNMFLKIRILEEERLLPVIPKASLIYRDGRFYVHVRTNGGFALREVRLLHEVTDKLVAVDSLRDGDEVAASAIDLEKT
jgi:cobalt-zinc-cadmium efflux system membrane fusion protein